ncbi:MAG: toll/interleukin-1 receptor domain-containing protein [Nitrosopumilus sp.]|jgi:hypothetical protein|nr:toll/interleukin-1 receptor domain-containing protein [Nitrosopumilus sp.]
MQAFISYSHLDNKMLEILHKHLAQLKREQEITAWTDNDILAGSNFEKEINSTLEKANLFIALLSPDYIASKYCYEKEFTKALELQEEGKLLIVPIILEDCDWEHTPFAKFKALPRDGKAISTWENLHTAFLDVIQNLRSLTKNFRLITPESSTSLTPTEEPIVTSRNYRVQKDFDSIEKMEHVENTFHEVKTYLKRYNEEILQIENIKVRILKENENEFSCLLVNRNKINSEAQLNLSTSSSDSRFLNYNSPENSIIYKINPSDRSPIEGSFILSHDQYHMFWTENKYYSSGLNNELSSKQIANIVWNEWLISVGIL